MPSVAIDAGVLAMPPENSEADAARRYAETVLGLYGLRKNKELWVDVYINEENLKVVCDNYDVFYPKLESLKKLFVAKEVKEYSPDLVLTLATKLLDSAIFEEHFEKHLGKPASEVLENSSIIKCDPGIRELVADNAFQPGLTHCLILIAILQHRKGATHNHLLVLQHAPKSTVTVQAKILALPDCPETLCEKVPICEDVKGLIQGLSASEILASCEDEETLKAAIKIALYQSRLKRGKNPIWHDDLLQNLRIGGHFLDTLRKHGKSQGSGVPEKVLRAIVKTLNKEDMSGKVVHQLKRTSGSDNRPRVRKADGAIAMRRDIDRDFHLHYWSCKNGTIELADIAYPHGNLHISE